MASNYTWTPPKVFQNTENINADTMNTYVSENMRYLRNPTKNIQTMRNIGDFSTTSSGTLVKVSTTYLRISAEPTEATDYLIWMKGAFQGSTAGSRQCVFDILMDDTTYLSSNTGTPLTNGLHGIYYPESGRQTPIDFTFVYENLPAGYHFFDLMFRIPNGGTVTLNTNPILQYGIREV